MASFFYGHDFGHDCTDNLLNITPDHGSDKKTHCTEKQRNILRTSVVKQGTLGVFFL